MQPTYPSTHSAVVTTAKRAPLEILDFPTKEPRVDEVVVKVEWTASSPLDLHQADGGLLVEYPYIMGSSFAGTIVSLGAADRNGPPRHNLRVGQRVAGFAKHTFQTYLTVPSYQLGAIPDGLSLTAAVTVPTNLVTAFHTITKDLKLELPWPKSDTYVPSHADTPVLIWGAGSSVGIYTVQVLHHWGYRNVIAVASAKHHDDLRAFGASRCFDYRDKDVVSQIKTRLETIPYMIDCIGSVDETLQPLSQLATRGTTLAIMMPAIVVHASAEAEPVLSMNPSELLPGSWAEGVELIGTRTHFYADNVFFKKHLQQEIVPDLLASGIIKPNKQRIVEGKTFLERAQNALDLLRSRAPSGERLVWRVSDE